MKKLAYMVVGFATVATLFTSCKNGFLEGINDDPNRPTEVNAAVLLPAAEASIAYTQGGDVNRFATLFAGHITGVSRQFFGYQNYVCTEEDFNNLWNNIYAGAMKDLDDIIDISDETPGSYTVYGGIARILMAHALGMTTDMFGDIPYSDAFKGNESPTPAYDTQEEIYGSIQDLLQAAIDSLTADPGDDLIYPFIDDNIYTGDVTKWIQCAHALQARYYIHLSVVDGANAGNAIAALSGGMTSSGDDAQYGFSATGPGPWYQYIEQRDDIGYFGFLLDNMAANADPRYPIYVDVDGVYWGAGYLGPYYSADNSPVELITYAEQKFIEAEANNRTGASGAAETALRDAISANMGKLGVDGAASAAYVDAVAPIGGTGTGEAQLQLIMEEKYKAMFLHFESWTDFRRTGYPAIPSNVSGLEVPRRFIYPTNENVYNAANIPANNSTLYSPALWWDL